MIDDKEFFSKKDRNYSFKINSKLFYRNDVAKIEDRKEMKIELNDI
jgi:hypothetical protein